MNGCSPSDQDCSPTLNYVTAIPGAPRASWSAKWSNSCSVESTWHLQPFCINSWRTYPPTTDDKFNEWVIQRANYKTSQNSSFQKLSAVDRSGNLLFFDGEKQIRADNTILSAKPSPFQKLRTYLFYICYRVTFISIQDMYIYCQQRSQV